MNISYSLLNWFNKFKLAFPKSGFLFVCPYSNKSKTGPGLYSSIFKVDAPIFIYEIYFKINL